MAQRTMTPRRPSLLTRAACLLAFFLAATWALSLVAVLRLHQLDRRDSKSNQKGLPPLNIRRSRDGVGDQERPDSTPGQAGLQTPAKRRNGEVALDPPQGSMDDSSDVHVVFSTDCSGYQHWQSLASYYSLRRAGHRGPITRVVSGCLPREEAVLRREFDEIRDAAAGGGQLRVHFTSSFALAGERYKYSNKPGGVDHWLRHQHRDDKLREAAIALVDPDMLALRPLVPQLGEGTTSRPVARDGYRDLAEYRDARDRALVLRRQSLPPLPPRMAEGVAAGQHCECAVARTFF